MKITQLFTLLVLIAHSVGAQKRITQFPAQIDFFNQMRFTADLQLVERTPCSVLRGTVSSIKEINYDNAVHKEFIHRGASNHSTLSTFDVSGFRKSVVLQIETNVDTIKFDYFDNGGYINKIHRSDYNKPHDDVFIIYDSNNRVQSESVNDKMGNKTGEATFTYNNNGSLEEIDFGSSKWIYSYSATGYSIHEYGGNFSTVFTFKGRYLLQVMEYLTKNNKKYEQVKFDGKGNIIEDNTYYENGRISEKKIYRYLKFDTKDNWILRTVRTISYSVSLGGIDSEMDGDLEQRTILYYK